MLHIHRAERADRLVSVLGGVLAEPLEDAFAPEVVAVPSAGVERWLGQQLATVLGARHPSGDGICANVRFPFPGRLVGDAVTAVTGVTREDDPWRPERAVWPLMDVIDAHVQQAWLRVLRRHLDGAGTPHGQPSRRFAAARRLADLYDRYAVHRPELLVAWADGRDVDDAGVALPADCAWQGRLWRLLAESIGGPPPPTRLSEACARLRTTPGAVDLPSRLAVFGLTRLPPTYLDVLGALAAHRDVHLLLLHPSPVLWHRVAGTPVPRRPRRTEDPTAALARHPLLASWGRDAREMQPVLASSAAEVGDHHHEGAPPVATLLGRLQRAVRDDEPPPGAPLGTAPERRPELDPADDSLQVHACHGRARQVEVVRDAVLHLLDTHPHLEPRDVVVLCPDIETYAPLVHAAFGPIGVDSADAPTTGSRPPGLRVRLADRSLRQTNPVLRVVADLLALADQRLTAADVLGLAARGPVRRRFDLSDDDLSRVAGWVAQVGIRWGLDAPARQAFGLQRLADGTWSAGVERILAGVAVDEAELCLIGGVLPLDDVGSTDIDLAGRLAELLARLRRALVRLRGSAPLPTWLDAIGRGVAELTDARGPDAWQRVQLDRLLADLQASAGPTTTPLALADVRTLLADRLRGRPTRTSFRTGHLTICTLVPMRSVPHRVVCLLGLDDGAFPRRTRPDGDDLLARDPRVGDQDPRSEDRQLLLDALLAASEHLVIAYAGRDDRTNAVRPPAVPVGELLDVVDATVRVPPGPSGEPVRARDRLVVEHPLQPTDPRVFAPGALVPGRPWGFDEVALAGARAAAGERSAPEPFVDVALPPPADQVAHLADVEAFLGHPVRAFLRQRLGVSLGERDRDPGDALPVELDDLEAWAVSDRLLRARLAGASIQACCAAERASGSLPAGGLGDRVLAELGERVDAIADAAAELLGDPAAAGALDVRVPLHEGRVLTGTVPGVREGVIAQVSASSLGPRQRLTTWVRLLAVAAAEPHIAWVGLTIGRRGRRAAVATITPPDVGAVERKAWALAHLAVLLDLHRRGLCAPLPLPSRAAAAWAQAVADGVDPVTAARDRWTSTYERAREDADAEHLLLLGGQRPLDDLLAITPAGDERGPGWAEEEPTRLGRLARRLWDGLLSVEVVRAR